ncbi:hypothetical protein FEM48_Zijuj08G0103800 [Ziziphus jujuba var. spinosa]|uniref:DNA-directed RNA polymerase III subunit RPC5 n=1 Tax=Ziziphus jujuba var. spinosa TaxID=714518 RepID=A0A978UYJ4_ZIZJJ|nr:hypothetical protein FEM48_Zijuj08G0103800 [Ziziphus jujuba var. spinosa]
MSMDLEDFDAPNQTPSRISRFAPKSKFKPRPKSEPTSKPEPQESIPKAEPGEPAASKTATPEVVPRKFEGIEVPPPKSDVSASNGAVKLEVEPKVEATEEPKGNDPMEEDAAEDTVIREIDVFLNPKIDDETQVRVKPASAEVEVDLALDVDSKNYDQEFGSKLRMTKQPPRKTGYAIGVLMEVFSIFFILQLHLNPIHAVVQLRPSLEHLTCPSSKRKNSVTGDADDTVKLEESSQRKPIGSKKQNQLMYFVSVSSLPLKKQVHSSVEQKTIDEENRSGWFVYENAAFLWFFNYCSRYILAILLNALSDLAGDPVRCRTDNYLFYYYIFSQCWVPLKYHGSGSEFSSRYLERMVAQERAPLQFTLNPYVTYDYIDSLCPGSNNNDVRSKGPSRRLLLSLPLEERMQKLLSEGAAVHKFNALKHFAPDCTAEAILDVLQRNAILVQGLWALKSRLLFPLPTKENFMQRAARDYVLLLFKKSPVISFSLLKVPPSLKNFVNKFLNIFATERPSVKDWKFKEPTDQSFIKLYPDVVEKQEEVWAELERMVMKNFDDGKSVHSAKNASMTSRPGRSSNSDKGITKTVTVVPSGKTVPDDIREALSTKVLPKVIQDYKVCSFQLICQGLRDLALTKSNLPKVDARIVKAAEYGTDCPDELRKLVDQVAVNIHGVYVAKSSLDHPQYDPLRNIVIDLLRQNGPNAKLKKAEVFDAARKALKREVSSSEYSKVMNEFCVFKGALWTLKSGDGRPNV